MVAGCRFDGYEDKPFGISQIAFKRRFGGEEITQQLSREAEYSHAVAAVQTREGEMSVVEPTLGGYLLSLVDRVGVLMGTL